MKAALNDDMYFKPLGFVYPDDKMAIRVEDQLMLGNEIMISPVYEQNARGRYVYLPEEMKFIKFMPDGNWKFTGYEGLASHGGTLGLIIALWLYCRKTKLHYMDVLDMIAVATPITACFIRLANLMNSEIIGKPTDVPWAFIFERVDMQPRHPGQLYEAIAYLILFFIMIYLYKNYSKKLHRGFFFGLCLTYIFVFRFFIEFLKENQEAFEDHMMFNMGQWLSVPFIIIGVYFMFFYDRKKVEKK